MKRPILLASALLLLSVLVAMWHTRRRPHPVEIVPTLTGEAEYCLTCHADVPEISPSHPVQAFGCVICHGGQRLALQADLAHSTLRGGRNPSSLEVVEESCGGADCHSGDPASERNHIQRGLTSIQATYAGAIANIRYTFGAQPDLNALQGIYAIQDQDPESLTGILSLTDFNPDRETNPSIQAFAQNCLYCHLSAQPLEGKENARLNGCAACHTPSAGMDLSALSAASGQPGIHRLTTAMSYSQCNTCHNRGNYDLRLMQFLPRTDKPADRLNDYYQPIAQFVRCEWTLDCIDCHPRLEAMGDGDLYNNQKEIQYIQCRTCHGTLNELPRTRRITSFDDLPLRLARLNPVIDLKPGDVIIVTERGEALWNVRRLPDGTFEEFGKATGQRFTFRPVKGTDCQQKLDEQDSQACHQCHAVQRDSHP
ncbi:MAG: multiheme c-type cytochrome [Chloroflexota bacterium]